MLKTVAIALTLTAAAAVAIAIAQEASTGNEGHTMIGDMRPAAMAFMAANDRMHQGMAVKFTGNPDVDFIRGMVPHHQGAVDMARIVLEHGQDPEVRKFAESIIAAQSAEIKWMQDWLARNGG